MTIQACNVAVLEQAQRQRATRANMSIMYLHMYADDARMDRRKMRVDRISRLYTAQRATLQRGANIDDNDDHVIVVETEIEREIET